MGWRGTPYYVDTPPLVDMNKSPEWFMYLGVLTTYILLLFFAWLLVLSISGCSPGATWTVINLAHFAVVYGDIYGYGYAPYGAYLLVSSLVAIVDGQMFGPQHYQYPTAYYQLPTPVPSTTQGNLQPSVNPDKPAAKEDTAKSTTNGVPNGTAHSNSRALPLGSSHQNSSLIPNGTYRAPLLGGVPSDGYLDSVYWV